MKIIFIFQKCLTIIALSMVSLAPAFAAAQENKPPTEFESFNIPPGIDRARMDALGRVLDSQRWPQTEVRYVAPDISKLFIPSPESAVRESRTYSSIGFGEEVWGKCKWSRHSLAEKSRTLPKVLPPDLKEKYLENIPPEQRSDSDFVKAYLNRKLDRYRKSQRYRLDGEMVVEVSLAPSSRAAQEYLLSSITENQMSTEGLVGTYTAAKRPEDLGDISFLTASRNEDHIQIQFIRANVHLNIRARGVFADQALHAARKIDALIVGQPAFTYQQLLDRRPSVTIAAKPDGQKRISYDISIPAGQKIVSVRAFLDGQSAAAKGGYVSLGEEKGKVKVKVIAITRDLLAAAFEREVVVGK